MGKPSFTIGFVFVLCAVVRADVITVPGDHATVQDAVDAAVAGDLILLGPSAPEATVTIVGKGISLVGDGEIVSLRRITIEDVPAGETVVLRNLDAVGNSVGRPGLSVENCDGTVRADDCIFRGRGGSSGFINPFSNPTDGGEGACVLSSSSVAFNRCTLTGGDGADFFDEDFENGASNGGPGLHVLDTDVAVYGCTVTGGDGGSLFDTVPDPGGNGGNAIESFGDSVHDVSGSTLTGGNGGSADCSVFGGCGLGGTGGHGVRQAGKDGALHTRDNTYAPGTGGEGGKNGLEGMDGFEITTAGTHLDYGHAFRGFWGDSPVREGETLTLHSSNAAGDSAYLFASLLPDHVPVPKIEGVVLFAFPPIVNGLFVTPVLEPLMSTPAPPLPLGVENLDVHVQAVYQEGGTGRFLLGPATVVSILDDAVE